MPDSDGDPITLGYTHTTSRVSDSYGDAVTHGLSHADSYCVADPRGDLDTYADHHAYCPHTYADGDAYPDPDFPSSGVQGG